MAIISMSVSGSVSAFCEAGCTWKRCTSCRHRAEGDEDGKGVEGGKDAESWGLAEVCPSGVDGAGSIDSVSS